MRALAALGCLLAQQAQNALGSQLRPLVVQPVRGVLDADQRVVASLAKLMKAPRSHRGTSITGWAA